MSEFFEIFADPFEKQLASLHFGLEEAGLVIEEESVFEVASFAGVVEESQLVGLRVISL